MAAERSEHGVAVLDGKLYAVGGFGDDGGLSSVEQYDPATNAWEAVASMVTPRENHAVAVLDGKLYAVGGYNGGYLTSVERYDPATDAWEAVAPMATARYNLNHAVAALDGKLYVAADWVPAITASARWSGTTRRWVRGRRWRRWRRRGSSLSFFRRLC